LTIKKQNKKSPYLSGLEYRQGAKKGKISKC